MGSVDITSIDAFHKQMTNNTVMCFYHWNKCGHCQTYMPVWEKITRIYPGVKIELTTMKLLEPRYQVSAFPVVAIYKKGIRVKELVGARDEKNLLEFAKDNIGKIADVKKKDKIPVKKTIDKAAKKRKGNIKNKLKK